MHLTLACLHLKVCKEFWASYIFSCVFDCSYCTKIQLGNNPEFGKNTTFSPYPNGGLFLLSWFFPLKKFYFPIWIRSIFPTCSRSFLHYSRANEWVSNELNTFATNDRAPHKSPVATTVICCGTKSKTQWPGKNTTKC